MIVREQAAWIVRVFACGVLGCGDDSAPAPAAKRPPDPTCAAPELALPDSTCIRPGIPPDGCAAGFVHDGEYGCEPILPAELCPPGLMAVPGDAECRPVMPCGPGKWGDIPVEPATVYVDAAYAGGASDGSEQNPWTTIGDALAGAPDGALVAVAEGSYAENVVIAFQAARLWGVCPDKVEIVGSSVLTSGCPAAAICIRSSASGTEVHGIAVRGDGVGIALSGSEQVLIDRVWVHDNASRGINVQQASSATSMIVAGSLVENNIPLGVYISGAETIIEASVVRSTVAGPGQTLGRGITAQIPCEEQPDGSLECDASVRAKLTVKGSLVDDNHEAGVYVLGSDATIDASVVRGTRPQPVDGSFGLGLRIAAACDSAPDGTLICDPTRSSNVALKGSLVDGNQDVGVFVYGSEASLENTVVRGTLPQASNQTGGWGISGQIPCRSSSCDPTLRSRVTLQTSLVDQNHELGVFIYSSDVTIEASVVRRTLPGSADLMGGRGLNIQTLCETARDGSLHCDPAGRSNAMVRGSLIADNHELGVFVAGSDATIEATIVRGTLPRASDQTRGRGIYIGSPCVETPNGGASCDSEIATFATVKGSLVDQSHDVGVFIIDSEASIEATIVRSTLAQVSDGRFGDGISVRSERAPARLTLTDTRIEDSARAGLSNFGGFVSLGGTTIDCAAFELEGEPQGDSDFVFDDRGSNVCGCPMADPPKPNGTCTAVSVGLEPPEAIGAGG